MLEDILSTLNKLFENIEAKESMEYFVNCLAFSMITVLSRWMRLEIFIEQRLQTVYMPCSGNLNFTLKVMYNQCLVLSRLVINSLTPSFLSFILPPFLSFLLSYDQCHARVCTLGFYKIGGDKALQKISCCRLYNND